MPAGILNGISSDPSNNKAPLFVAYFEQVVTAGPVPRAWPTTAPRNPAQSNPINKPPGLAQRAHAALTRAHSRARYAVGAQVHPRRTRGRRALGRRAARCAARTAVAHCSCQRHCEATRRGMRSTVRPRRVAPCSHFVCSAYALPCHVSARRSIGCRWAPTVGAERHWATCGTGPPAALGHLGHRTGIPPQSQSHPLCTRCV